VSASDAVARTLRSLGVDCVFGLPGTQTVELFEALNASGIRTVLSTHELAASFMANGYHRASGKVGVVVTIPGPGFTYALTGLAEASLDSAALLHIVGPGRVVGDRPYQLQAIDQAGIARPLVKAVFEVGRRGSAGEREARVSEGVRAAYELAARGGPGPVLLDLGSGGRTAAAGSGDGAADARAARRPDQLGAALGTLRARFRASARPVLLLGQGAHSAARRIQALAERHTVPVLTTASGRGAVPEDHALAMGFDVLRGSVDEANRLLARADLVLALGARLGHNGSAGYGLHLAQDRLVHVDVDPEVPGASYPASLAIGATVEEAVGALEPLAPSERAGGWGAKEIAAFRERLRAAPADGPEPAVHGAPDATARGFFAWLRTVLPRDAILVTDSGLHQVLARRYFDVLAPRGLVTPTDFQSMGFGLPAAIGAKLAAPARPVAVLLGDGGFLMSGMELLTAARERIPLLVVVFNDGKLNQIRLQQIENHGRTHAVDLRNPDFELLAGAFGVAYARYGEHRPAELRDALTRPGPTLLEVRLGDSWPLRRVRAASGAKGLIRRLLGPQATRLLKGLAGHRPSGSQNDPGPAGSA
jgi:acetolactate synthase-1/2/3 large subunit